MPQSSTYHRSQIAGKMHCHLCTVQLFHDFTDVYTLDRSFYTFMNDFLSNEKHLKTGYKYWRYSTHQKSRNHTASEVQQHLNSLTNFIRLSETATGSRPPMPERSHR